MNTRFHRPDLRDRRRSDKYVATMQLGTTVLLPRNPHQNRALADYMLRLPSGRIT